MPASPDTPPLVLIVPGSGPTDRDGNSPLGIQASSYRLLAEGLAARGIASLRIDKRGLHGSAAAVAGPDAVTLADYADDLAAWLEVLRREGAADCVWLLGHSEGGLVALAAARRVPALCGLILVATPGHPFADVLRRQLRANLADGELLVQALAAVDILETGGAVEAAGLDARLLPLFRPAVQGYLRDLMDHDPAELLAAYAGPVLVLQGLADLQVTEEDARRLAGAAPRTELVLLKGVNHVLKAVPEGDIQANLASYADPRRPLAADVVEAVVGFLNGAR